jgi:predicted dehydrogenase
MYTYRTDLNISRRGFLAASLAGLTMAGLPEWFTNDAKAAELDADSRRPRRIGPNDRIAMAVVGCGGSRGGFCQGRNDTGWISSKPGVEVVAVCDVDGTHLQEAADMFTGSKKYTDFREVMARKDIDAIVCGTPDHWHTIIAIAAMKSGKDIYCEKPLTLTIDEGKKLVKVWKETGAVFQVGSQQRSDARFRLACELVRNGRLGKIRKVEAHLPAGPVGGPFEVKAPPADFNWDMWQGQTPSVDYVQERTHGSFRYWLCYSGGMMTDWGAHHNDIAQWGLGMDGSGPIAVESIGVGPKIGVQCFSAIPEYDVTYTYPGGITLLSTSKGENGVQFEGENGWIFVSRSTIRASDPKLLEEPLPASATRLYASNDHAANFVDCIRNREKTICTAEVGHRSVSVCHIGNISLRLGGRKLEWDPVREEFKGDREANAMLSRPMRKPWHI